jgi:citrate synthase
MQPGVIRMRGYEIQDLIGRLRFAEMIWLMLRGELPTAGQADLLDCALVASVDHGPQAPSIAIARMAVTCGLPVNGAMASAVNVLDDVHGGAGEQCLALYLEALRYTRNEGLEAAVDRALGEFQAKHSQIVPGFGHRFHPIDPRAPRLMQAAQEAVKHQVVEGKIAEIARQLERALAKQLGRPMTMNIDGATAVICGELGFSPSLARGLFILSRSVGILAHAVEEKQQGKRLKGPMPPSIRYRYLGPAPRLVPART